MTNSLDKGGSQVIIEDKIRFVKFETVYDFNLILSET